MKFYSGSKKVIILLTALSGLFIFSAEIFAANIKRSCSAHYYGTVNSIKFTSNGRLRTLNVPYETISVSYREKEFSAQGGCGKLVPNRCRERARNKLLACAKAHAYSPNQIPEACRPNDTKYYPIQNLRSLVKERACGKLTSKDGIRVTDLLSGSYQVNILLGVFVNGKDYCGKNKPGKTVVDGQKHSIKGNKFFLSEPLKNFTFSCN